MTDFDRREETTLDKLARRAAILFLSERWEWYGQGIPDVAEIRQTIRVLATTPRIVGYEDSGPGGSGRLVVYSDGSGGVTVALELGTLSPREVDAL